MGCDGGSIPRRAEMVKTKGQEASIDDTEVLKTSWQCCYISKGRLEKPVVACGLGRMYNKDAVIKYLLQRKAAETPDQLNTLGKEYDSAHIVSLKSVFDVNLDGCKRDEEGFFICPVTGRSLNGRSRAFVIKGCGCIFAEQAWKELRAGDCDANEASCLVCGKRFNVKTHMIPLHSTIPEELNALKANLPHASSKRVDHGRTIAAAPAAEEDGAKRLLNEIIEQTRPMEALKRTRLTDELYLKHEK